MTNPDLQAEAVRRDAQRAYSRRAGQDIYVVHYDHQGLSRLVKVYENDTIEIRLHQDLTDSQK